ASGNGSWGDSMALAGGVGGQKSCPPVAARYNKTPGTQAGGGITGWGRRSEVVDVGNAVDHRVDVHGADGGTIQLDLGVDVGPAGVDAQGTVVADLEVHADVGGQAPGVIQLQLAAGQRTAGGFTEEGGVVHAQADQRRYL